MPSPFVALIIALAAYRATRLGGWDDFPLAVKIRAWVIGQRWIAEGRIETVDQVEFLLAHGSVTPAELEEMGWLIDADAPTLPGKQPPSEVEGVRPAYDRPTLAHLIHCPYCLGFWTSLATWVAWLSWHPVVYGLMPFAISGFVGLVAKNLDA